MSEKQESVRAATNRHLSRNLLKVFAAIVLSSSASLVVAGERYTDAGNALGKEINRELVRRHFCEDASSCDKYLPIYGSHGKRVNFAVYGVSERNREALSAIVEMITRRGPAITGGVPISVRAYPMPHDYYVNVGMFREKQPILTLEVLQ